MKRIYLLGILQIVVFTVFVQKNGPVNVQRPEPVNPVKDNQEYQGFTIRLMPAMPMQESMDLTF